MRISNLSLYIHLWDSLFSFSLSRPLEGWREFGVQIPWMNSRTRVWTMLLYINKECSILSFSPDSNRVLCLVAQVVDCTTLRLSLHLRLCDPCSWVGSSLLFHWPWLCSWTWSCVLNPVCLWSIQRAFKILVSRQCPRPVALESLQWTLASAFSRWLWNQAETRASFW